MREGKGGNDGLGVLRDAAPPRLLLSISLLRRFEQQFLCLVDFERQHGRSATIRVVDLHERAVAREDAILVGALTHAQNARRLALAHLVLETALVHNLVQSGGVRIVAAGMRN